MMTKQNPDLKKFLVRLGVTVAAVVLVMYLAKGSLTSDALICLHRCRREGK
ncbi:MAG: hypothetical protein QW358_02150 [Candidatus Hadarchaeum sp.]